MYKRQLSACLLSAALLTAPFSASAIVNTLNFRYISETINQYHPFDFSAGFF